MDISGNRHRNDGRGSRAEKSASSSSDDPTRFWSQSREDQRRPGFGMAREPGAHAGDGNSDDAPFRIRDGSEPMQRAFGLSFREITNLCGHEPDSVNGPARSIVSRAAEIVCRRTVSYSSLIK